MSTPGDLLLRGGTFFDGTGAPGREADVLISGGQVKAAGKDLQKNGAREIDACGQWVMPGFFDIHTHYDAEVEAFPGLEESVRHGVTSIVFGNCSLSTVLGTEEQLLDLFCRVESLPRELLARWLGGKVTWKTPKEYYDHLETLPLGPNIASFLGHSNVRMAVLGTERALKEPKASPEEIEKMRALVQDAMEAGFLGFSIDLLPWHRWDGEAFRGISVPSQQADPSEYAKLADVVRKYGRVLQATPNALLKSTVLRIIGLSAGVLRKPLKTTIVAAMDVKTDRRVWRMATALAETANRMFNANVRWQALAEPFLNYADGVNTPLFEELPAGVAAISASPENRRALFQDPSFRKQFRREWEDRGQRVFHRDLADMFVVSAPDAQLAGKSFAAIAQGQHKEALECFMDLLALHDNALRWKTVVTNDREGPRMQIFASETTLPGFNDSGAHNRNMAFQDGALEMLQQVQAHPEVMPLEKAIWKLTGATAAWMGLQAGTLLPGDAADVTVVNPEKLKTGLGPPIEYNDPRLGGLMRMVKRSEGVVTNVVIGGQMAFESGAFTPDYGRKKMGRLLRAGAA